MYRIEPHSSALLTDSFLEIDASTEQATPVNPRKIWDDLMSVSPAEKAENIVSVSFHPFCGKLYDLLAAARGAQE